MILTGTGTQQMENNGACGSVEDAMLLTCILYLFYSLVQGISRLLVTEGKDYEEMLIAYCIFICI